MMLRDWIDGSHQAAAKASRHNAPTAFSPTFTRPPRVDAQPRRRPPRRLTQARARLVIYGTWNQLQLGALYLFFCTPH